MRDWIKAALAEGIINSADTAFADLMQTMATQPSKVLWSAAVLASASVQNGDVCTTLSEIAATSDNTDDMEVRQSLQACGMVQGPEMPVSLPLVLDAGGRLYLSRYWQAEYKLAGALLSLVKRSDLDNLKPGDCSVAQLNQLFPPASQAQPDWQRVAAVVAARQSLCVITGGPGTGKTRTVARLLALLQSQHLQTQGSHLSETQRIALLAPTGKAAARLLESLRRELGKLEKEGLPVNLPHTAATVHRTLGYLPGRTGFKHNERFPLPFDIVLVDEASMVDLTLMYSLVSALDKNCRLILLGDRDQLASVEAGNVLGDIVGEASPQRYSAAQRQVLKETCDGFDTIPNRSHQTDTRGLTDVVVELQHSYRFDAQSGLGHFARAVNAGEPTDAISVAHDKTYPDLTFINPDDTSLQSHLIETSVTAAQQVMESGNIEAALQAALDHRVLCALHGGPRGVDQMNRYIESRLIRLGHMQPNQLWYQGRPLLITHNDPGTGLYNGDTGLIWPDGNNNMMAWFADSETGARAIAPGRLPAHRTCYAMTVHKTQGSEFTNVLLVLPEPPHTLLSRDLLYTGVTRARKAVKIYASEEAVQYACKAKRERASGLRDLLWGQGKTKGDLNQVSQLSLF